MKCPGRHILLWAASSLTVCVFSLNAFAGACPGGASYNVHLTFDDGPHPVRTPRVLDALKEKQVPATFFVMGSLIQKSTVLKDKEAILARIKQENTLASHTFEHKSHTCGGRLAGVFTADAAKKNLDKARGGRDEIFTSNLFRFPYGKGWLYDRKCPDLRGPIMDYAHKLGLQHLGWDIDSEDYKTNPPFFKPSAKIIPGILRQICEQKGGVILMHDINPWTARHLREVIDAVRAAGHRFTPLDEISKDRDSFNQAPGGVSGWKTEVHKDSDGESVR